MRTVSTIFTWRLTAWLFVGVLCVAACEPARSAETRKEPQPRKLRVVVLGAHPDDPESGAGGLIVMLTRAGHEVFVGYMVCFREGRQYYGQPEAQVRRKEAEEACKIMGATSKFFPHSAGNLIPDAATVSEVSAWLKEVKPDIVATHWPMDTHPDHHATSSLIWQCYNSQGRQGGWSLYYFEVNAGLQTLGFKPELYLDIGAVRATKQKALFCHKCQAPEVTWRLHEQMHRDRGVECGVKYAEAYALVEARPGSALLPVQFLTAQRQPR